MFEICKFYSKYVNFLKESLKRSSGPSTMNELRSSCIRAFRAAVAAVQPYERVRDVSALIFLNGTHLTIQQFNVGKRA